MGGKEIRLGKNTGEQEAESDNKKQEDITSKLNRK